MPSQSLRPAKGLLIGSIEDDDPVITARGPKRALQRPFRNGDPNKPAVPWNTHPKGEVPAELLHGAFSVAPEIVRGWRAADDHCLRHHGARGRGRRSGHGGSTRRSSTCAASCRSMSTTLCNLGGAGPEPLRDRPRRRRAFAGFSAARTGRRTVMENCFSGTSRRPSSAWGRLGHPPTPHAFEWEYFPGQGRACRLALKAVMEPK